jgi:ribosomal protein S13
LEQLFAQGDGNETIAKLKVVSVLESLPGVGKVKARRLMQELDISESRRLRGLGGNQRRKLLDRFA